MEKLTNYSLKCWSILAVMLLSLSRDFIWLWNQQDYFSNEVLFIMGKGNKIWSFGFHLTTWCNLSPCCNMVWGSFKRYHRTYANRSAGEFLPYVLGRCCVPTLIWALCTGQGRWPSIWCKRKVFSQFWEQNTWFGNSWTFVGCADIMLADYEICNI